MTRYHLRRARVTYQNVLTGCPGGHPLRADVHGLFFTTAVTQARFSLFHLASPKPHFSLPCA